MTSSNQNIQTFDDFLQTYGEFGRYQARVWFLYSIVFSLTSMQLTGWVFVGAELPHRCILPNETLNVSYDSISLANIERFQCRIQNESCSKGDLVYDERIVGDSIVKEWGLVCEDSEKKSRISAAVMLGYLMGSIIFGTLPDKIGRKNTLLIGGLSMFISGCFSGLSQGYYSFLVSRALVGIAVPVVESSLLVMGIELVGPSKRTLAGIGQWYFESFGFLLTVLIAFLVNSHWRVLQFIYTGFLCLIGFYYWIAPESPRWLLSKGRYDEATAIMKKVLKSNGHEMESKVLVETMKSISEIGDESSRTTSYNYWDLFKYPNMRLKTIILSFLWSTISGMYYIMLLDQKDVSENIYVGFLITSLIQIPGYIFSLLIIQHPKLGRKMSLVLMLLLTGGCLSFYPFLYIVPDVPWIGVAVSIIGRFGANCCYSIVCLFGTEIYPTVIRSTGISLNASISRLSCILAPYVLLLGWYSSLVFGSLCVLSGFLTLLLPETNQIQLPDTIEESENFKITFPTFGCNKLKNNKEGTNIT